jgi:hypothetical protein
MKPLESVEDGDAYIDNAAAAAAREKLLQIMSFGEEVRLQ